jgi:putative ABC transport system permease protein
MMLWKEYSIGYMKNNRAASISIVVAALISSLFISLIGGIFYNMWTDNIRRIVSEEGDWQGRLTGDISEKDVEIIESYSNVKEVILGEDGAGGGKTASVYFHNPRSIYKDLPQIARLIGFDPEKDAAEIQYHNMLLSEYFIFSPEEKENPPLLLAFYVLVLLITCFSLILIIRNAFGVSMNARLHQLGILQSIGATPGQIRSVLIQEALFLCLPPVLLGIAAGIGLCFGFMQFANSITGAITEEKAVFYYHPVIFLTTLSASLLTVWISARLPARKLSKLSPLEAIRGGAEQPVKKVKRFRFLSALLGIEGELAGKSIYVRRKAYRTSTLSLTLSFLVFSIFLNFMTLSDISTQHTYFERYHDVWDLMLTVEGEGMNEAELLQELRNISGVSACTAYQKAAAYTYLSENMLSDELTALGGLKELTGTGIAEEEGKYLVHVPLIILDDDSYREYCNYAGLEDKAFLTPGMVTVNRIWNNAGSNFRDRQYIPFIKAKEGLSLELLPEPEPIKEILQVAVLDYTDKEPALREEYDDFSLLQVMSASSYRRVAEHLSTEEAEVYFNVLAASEEEIADIRNEIDRLLDGRYEYTLENRLEEETYNAEVREGYMLIMGGLCGLLACIGFANVFFNTLGYIYQRRREFARYLSVGLTPRGVRKVLASEAFIIGVKPIVISLPLNILFVVFAVNASHLQMSEYMEHMPVVPLTVFAIIILAFVGLAYSIGGGQICRGNIVEAIKDDTMY